LPAARACRADFGVAVRMGGDVDGVDIGARSCSRVGEVCGTANLRAKGFGAFRISAPDCLERRGFDGVKALGEARGGAAGADDPEADLLRAVVGRIHWR